MAETPSPKRSNKPGVPATGNNPGGSGDAPGGETGKEFLILRSGRAWMALNPLNVREIADCTDITPLPRCPPHLPGLLNLRGQAVALLDLARFLDLSDADETHRLDSGQYRVAIVTSSEMTVGLVCEQIRGVIEIPERLFTTPELTQGTRLAGFVTSQADIEGDVILLLDLPCLLEEARV